MKVKIKKEKQKIRLDGDSRPRLILPRGSESPQIMFIADSASDDEFKSGYAMSGFSENQLKYLCKSSEINFKECYRTLYVKARISYNGLNKKQLRDAFQDALDTFGWDYQEILWQEICTLKPRLIVPMGDETLSFLVGVKSIEKFRGSILSLRNDLSIIHPEKGSIRLPKVAPTHSPKTLAIRPELKAISQVDFNRFAKYLNSPEELDQGLVSVADSYEKFRSYLQRYINAPFGVFDIETKFNIPVCIGICLSPKEAVCVPLLDKSVSKEELYLLWNGIWKIYQKFKWVNQNIKFDILGMERLGFILNQDQFHGDTSINAGILYPEFPKNLGFLNSLYTDIPYFKDEGKDAQDREKLYIYCAKDCISTYRIYLQQQEEISELKLNNFQDEVLKCFWPYVRMERRGLLIDDNKKTALFAKYDVIYGIQRRLLNKLINKEVNPHSPKQLGEVIYGEFKFKEKRDRQTKNLLTDEDSLLELLAFEGQSKSIQVREAINSIIVCRKVKKILEYLETPVHPDGRLRTSYNLSGTDTGRSSAGKTTDFLLKKVDNEYFLSSLGRSFHQIPKHGFKIGSTWYGRDLRSIYVPTPGHIFVEGDLSQAEARVDCILAEDYHMLPKFDIFPGMHVLTGTWIFGRQINKKLEPDLYHFAKTVRHAGERNMQEYQLFRLVQEVMPGMTISECEEALVKFHSNQPNIKGIFHEQIIQFVNKNSYLTSPQGRRRDFFGRESKDLYNAAISQIPQATVSDHIKFSLPRILEKFPNALFVYEGHDALMCEIRKDELEEYSKIFSDVTSRPINFRKCSLSRDFELIIPCEIVWSENSWEDMQPLVN